MFRKFTVRLFSIIFLPLVACQLPGGQAVQPTELPTPAPTTPSMAEPSPTSIEGDSVEFETVSLNLSGSNIDFHYVKSDTQLFFLTSLNDISLIQNEVTSETLQSLQSVDFKMDLVVVLFRGTKPSLNYETIMESILQEDRKLIVNAQFWEPGGRPSGEAMTYPYHIVKVSRSYFTSALPELVLRIISVTPTPPAQ